MKRRHFIQLAAAGIPAALLPLEMATARTPRNLNAAKIRISLNAYSFNAPLMAGQMTVNDMITFAAHTGLEAVDLTGYYFPGYPAVPSDEYIFNVKRHAFRMGVEICGSGVRNNLTLPDASKRAAEKKHIMEWIEVASKLGAQTLRIFAGGNGPPDGYTWEQTANWMAADILECAEHARRNGVMLGLQNHFDFLKTADDVLNILKKINSEWVGLMLDIGSYRSADPYHEIERTVQHAITWQVKEEVFINGKPVKTDFDRLHKIVTEAGYCGYLPIETLGSGDPRQKVTAMYQEIRKRFA